LFIKISVMRFKKNNFNYLQIKNIEDKTNIFPKLTNCRMSSFNITSFIFVLRHHWDNATVEPTDTIPAYTAYLTLLSM